MRGIGKKTEFLFSFLVVHSLTAVLTSDILESYQEECTRVLFP